jgi:predicted lipoprotein with Yx(FWY)xxD motif
MKRVSLLLVVLLAMGSWASGQITDGQWTYIVEDGGATIRSSTATGAVTIPSVLGGYAVKKVGYGLSSIFPSSNSSVTSVAIPASVTSIGRSAFQSCTGLTSVNIGNSVTYIGGYAFRGCTGLTSVVIPGSVTSIENNAFWECTGLTSVSIGNGVTSIGGEAFRACTGLTSVSIGNSVTSIGEFAFGECTGLTSVSIGNGVTSIGAYAFYLCPGLTSVVIPDSVTSIGEYVFFNCTGLTSVSIGNSVTSIGDGVFVGCTGLTSVNIPGSVTSLGNSAFAGCVGLTSVVIPGSVTSIGGGAFQSCTGLTSVTFGNSVVLTVGSSAFAECPLVGTITLPILATLGASAFPNGVTITRSSASLVTLIANEIVAALPNNYGIATKADLSGAIAGATTQAIAQVQSTPNNYDLYSPTQYQANRIAGVAEGKAEVTSNPTAYSLFTESSIMDMNLCSLMLKKGDGADALDLELTIETRDNLATNGWQVAERITRSISMDGVQRQFLRVRADAPYVAPNVKVLAHPTLGNILTDGAGRVLYFFAADSAGGNPLFSGSSWPYVTVPAAPKADAGVSAMPASSTFGKPGGPYLTLNARPVYTYVGDSEAGQANGQAAGWVWYTIKADGSINQ